MESWRVEGGRKEESTKMESKRVTWKGILTQLRSRTGRWSGRQSGEVLHM